MRMHVWILWNNFGDAPDTEAYDKRKYPTGPYCRSYEGLRFDFNGAASSLVGVFDDRVVDVRTPGADPYLQIYPTTPSEVCVPFLTNGSRYGWVITSLDHNNYPRPARYFDEEDHRKIVEWVKAVFATLA